MVDHSKKLCSDVEEDVIDGIHEDASGESSTGVSSDDSRGDEDSDGKEEGEISPSSPSSGSDGKPSIYPSLTFISPLSPISTNPPIGDKSEGFTKVLSRTDRKALRAVTPRVSLHLSGVKPRTEERDGWHRPRDGRLGSRRSTRLASRLQVQEKGDAHRGRNTNLPMVS